MFDKKVLEKTGLVESGKDEDGNKIYIGTPQQWNEANIMQIDLERREEE